MPEKLTFKKYGTVGTKYRVACNSCKGATNHLVLSSMEMEGIYSDDNGRHEMNGSSIYQIIQCQGCDTLSFRAAHSHSEDWDENGMVVHEQLFPNREEGRNLLVRHYLLPAKLNQIYGETVSSLNAKLHIVCGIGVRAIIETVTKERAATGRDLKAKIDSLVTLGVMTTEGAQILHKLRVLGNNAAHEVKEHTLEELSLALDVVDHLLLAVYILPQQAKMTFT